MPTRKRKTEIVMAILVTIAGCQSAHAALSDATLNSKLAAAKVLPKGASVRLVRTDGNLRVEISHYPTPDVRTQKIDALLLARTILHADPGGVNSLITRFSIDSDPGSYRDVVVSNRDIVGADAGIVGTDELLSSIEVVSIKVNDSVESRFAKYSQAAEQSLQNEDFRESENLFLQAYKESPDVSRSDPKYLASMVKLGQAYSGRDDVDDEQRVYRNCLNSLPVTTAPEALQAVRSVYNYYLSKSDYPNAERAAKGLVEVQVKTGASMTEQYASDLQLLAACHRRQGQVADAKKEYEEALMLKRNLLGQNHPALAEIFEGLGDCYADEKNQAQATDFWKQAKVAYDHAVVTKEQKNRISFEVYRSVIARLNTKLGIPEVKHRGPLRGQY